MRRIALFSAVFGIDDRRGALDEGDDVAHAQDAPGHSLGVELVEGIELLAHAHELDRLARDVLDRERGATARVAVELGEDDPVDVELVVEGLGRGDRVLPRHGVADEVDVLRLATTPDIAKLLHEVFVDMEATGGVEDDDVATGLDRVLDPVLANVGRAVLALEELGNALAFLLFFAVNGDLECIPEDLQLIDGGRALEVGGDEEGLLLALLDEILRELAAGRRLARPLEAHHHDDGRAGGSLFQARVDRPHEVAQLVVDDLDDLLAGIDARDHGRADGLGLDPLDEVLDDRDRDVGLEQGLADLAQALVDVGVGELAP